MLTHNVIDDSLIQRDIFSVLSNFQLTSQVNANSTVFDQRIWKSSVVFCPTMNSGSGAADWRRLQRRPLDFWLWLCNCLSCDVMCALLDSCSECWRLLSWLLCELSSDGHSDALGCNHKGKTVIALPPTQKICQAADLKDFKINTGWILSTLDAFFHKPLQVSSTSLHVL